MIINYNTISNSKYKIIYYILFHILFLINLIYFSNCKSIMNKPKGRLTLENNKKDIRLLILPFQIKKSKEYSWLGIGLTETISVELSKIPNIITFTQEDRVRALNEIANGQKGIFSESTLTQAGSFIGANYILSGNITIYQTYINVFIKISSVEKGTTVKSFKVDGTIENNGINEVKQQILKNLIEDFDEDDYSDSYFNEIPNTVAFENYSKGLEIKNIDPKKSYAYFKKSIEEYPFYVSAIKELSSISNKNTYENSFYIDKYNKIIIENNLINSKSHTELLYLEGENFYNKQEYETSLNRLYEAEKILRKSNLSKDSQLYAKVLFLTGQVYQKLNKRSEALEKYIFSKKILERNLFTKTKFYSEVKFQIKDLNRTDVNIETVTTTDKTAEDYINIGLDFYSKDKGEAGRPFIVKGINLYKSLGDFQNVEKYENILKNLDNKTKF